MKVMRDKRSLSAAGQHLLRLSATALAFAILAGPAAAQAPAPGGPAPSVIVETVRNRDAVDESAYIGRVQAIDKVNIRARVDGFLAKRGFDEGREVKKD